MFTAILNALKAIVSKVPWYKVPQFLAWAAEFATAAAKYSLSQINTILAFIKNNPGKIVTWFLNGYSVYDIIRQILGL
ncbi:AMEP412 family response elicitor [Bacillus sp. CGMCC 1.60114]|uniref:AMEP412 family response elicitor n=1 Tax=unclassified Bacillus (in: firmicutes) TaxID=185979 RepID=UPI003642EDBB